MSDLSLTYRELNVLTAFARNLADEAREKMDSDRWKTHHLDGRIFDVNVYDGEYSSSGGWEADVYLVDAESGEEDGVYVTNTSSWFHIRDLYTRMLSDKELASVLAAMRFWQNNVDDAEKSDELNGYGHFTAHGALTNAEIDELCERLNCSP